MLSCRGRGKRLAVFLPTLRKPSIDTATAFDVPASAAGIVSKLQFGTSTAMLAAWKSTCRWRPRGKLLTRRCVLQRHRTGSIRRNIRDAGCTDFEAELLYFIRRIVAKGLYVIVVRSTPVVAIVRLWFALMLAFTFVTAARNGSSGGGAPAATC